MRDSVVTGPLGVVLGPILAFATAPDFPVAILENRTALAAIRRGPNQRGAREDSGVVCAVDGIGNRGGVGLGVASSDPRTTVRPTMVSPASSHSGHVDYIVYPTVVHDCAYFELLGATRPRRRNWDFHYCSRRWLVRLLVTWVPGTRLYGKSVYQGLRNCEGSNESVLEDFWFESVLKVGIPVKESLQSFISVST
jgi:hypothetical protein